MCAPRTRERDRAAAPRRLDPEPGAQVGVEVDVERADVGRGGAGRDHEDAGSGAGREPGRLGVAGVEHGQAVGVERFDQLALDPRHAGAPAERPGVGEADVGDHTDGRSGDGAQRGDVAVGACAHLEHERLGGRGGCEQREGHARFVVVGTGTGVHGELGCKRGGDEVLGAGLARRPGDADDGGVVQRVAGRPAEARQCVERVGDEDDGEVRVGHRTRHQRDRRPAARGVGDVVVTVALSDQRNEACARLQRARVDGERGRARVGIAGDDGAAGDGGELARGQLHPSPPSSSRATTRSSNGTVRPALVWPVS